jgi:hypothetical protein
MQNTLTPHKVGLALGGLAGLIHLIWSILVGAGWAQPFLNWILRLHMIQPYATILPFSLGTAVALIVVTTVIGYIVGNILATIWNMVHKMK